MISDKWLMVNVVIGLMLFFCGCRTVKNNVREDYHREIESLKKTTETTDEKTTGKEVESSVENSELNGEFYEIGTTIELSAPDSLGKQYPTKISTIEKGFKANLKSDKKKDKTITNEQLRTTKRTEQENIKEEEDYEKRDKTVTKTETPAFITIGVVVLCLVVLVIVVFILRKYRMV